MGKKRTGWPVATVVSDRRWAGGQRCALRVRKKGVPEIGARSKIGKKKDITDLWRKITLNRTTKRENKQKKEKKKETTQIRLSLGVERSEGGDDHGGTK